MQDDAPQFIGKAKSSLPLQSPAYWQAVLYRLPDGVSFILAGAGGTESEFTPDTPEDKGRVIEMTESEAYNWAATYLSIDVVEEYFDHLSEEI